MSLYYIHLLFSEKFFGNRMMQTSPTNQPAKNLLRWITFTKIVRFGWNLVCKLITAPAHHYRSPLPPLPTITTPAHPFCCWPQYYSDFFSHLTRPFFLPATKRRFNSWSKAKTSRHFSESYCLRPGDPRTPRKGLLLKFFGFCSNFWVKRSLRSCEDLA